MLNATIPYWTAILLAVAAIDCAAEAPSKPNIIVILADDFGYECVGANGGRSYATPSLDRIARDGVRFTHCYAQPNCTPTRAQLMTGMSNVRNYVDFGSLDRSQTTFGNLLSRSGYATCIAGKWQLGSRDASLPKHFGFDEHCLWAHMGRGERYANPSLSVNGELQDFPGKYGPDICQNFVVDFIRRHRTKPFFVYYPMILTHGRYEPPPGSPDYGKPRATGKEANQRYFAEMVTYMDSLVGNLNRELETLGLANNTLILFTADNGTGRGAISELEDGSEQAGEKGSTTRAGMHVPLIAYWPGKIERGLVRHELVDTTDFLPTLCEVSKTEIPDPSELDGRSFLPLLRGEAGTPRDWIYSYWVPLRARQTAHLGSRGAVEQAFDHHYKLYSTGEFFHLEQDPEEQSPLQLADLNGDAAAAYVKLQAALDQFKDARPAHLEPPRNPAEKKRRKAR